MSELNEIANRTFDQIAGVSRVALLPTVAKRIIDESGAPGTTYVGVTAPGTATSTATWIIEKIVVSGATTTITHATDAWDNRSTASYT